MLHCAGREKKMEITNLTSKPLSLPLPGGKKVFLSPGKATPVSPKAIKHPPIVKLLEAGDIKKSESGPKLKERSAGKSGATFGVRVKGAGAMRQSGDR